MGNLKKCITINPGVFQDKVDAEAAEELELQKIDEAEIRDLQSKNKADDHKEAWDEVPEVKQEQGENEDEEHKQKAEVQVEIERLPRVHKPVGDVLEDLMRLDLGPQNVLTKTQLDLKELDE